MRGDRARGATVLAALLAALSLAVAGCAQSQSPPPRSVALATGGELAAWSPDGRLIAAPDGERVDLIRPDGSDQASLPAPGVARAATCACPLGWSRDGGEVLFLTRRDFSSRGTMVARVSLGGRVAEAPLRISPGDAGWSPQGWPLVFAAASGKGTASGLWRLDGLHATPRRIFSGPGFVVHPQVTPDGGQVLFQRKQHGRRSVWVVDADGSHPHLLAAGFWLAFAAWAPDGTRIAVTGFPLDERRSRIFTVSPSGRGRRTVPGTKGAGNGLTWSADGRWITYSAGEGQIWRVHPAGGGREEIGSLPEHEIRRLLGSPRGGYLAYAAPRIEPD